MIKTKSFQHSKKNQRFLKIKKNKGFKNKKIADFAFAVVTAVLSLISAVAWYVVVKSIISSNAGVETSILTPLLFAIVLTAITIFISVLFHNFDHKFK